MHLQMIYHNKFTPMTLENLRRGIKFLGYESISLLDKLLSE
jgi:hypothetical protein